MSIPGLGQSSQGVGQTDFEDKPPPIVALRARPQDQQKTIVVSGAPRGGTSFGASLVANFGIPFDAGEGRPVSMRYSNEHLKVGSKGDHARFAAECRRLDKLYNTWGFKLATFTMDSDFVSTLRNPHFIFVFKEPLSVAMRSSLLRRGGVDQKLIVKRVRTVISRYDLILKFAARTPAPVLLLSYDRAMLDLRSTMQGAAAFLGTPEIDEAALRNDLDYDRQRYWATSYRIDYDRNAPESLGDGADGGR